MREFRYGRATSGVCLPWRKAHDAGRFAWPHGGIARGSASRWKKLARYSWRKPPVATSRPTLGTPAMLDACADTIAAVLRLTGTLI